MGPVRYNSRLRGKGLKVEVGARLQFGHIKGLEELRFSGGVPRRFDVTGILTVLPSLSLPLSINFLPFCLYETAYDLFV